MARYQIVPGQSTVSIDARSSIHPINSRTTASRATSTLEVPGRRQINLTVPPAGELSFPVEQLRSGNPLEDRELRKRIDARRYPTIAAAHLKELKPTGRDGRYLVQRRSHVPRRDTRLRGRDEHHVPSTTTRSGSRASRRFDVRDFGMEPPRILMLKVEPEVDVRVEIVAEKEELTCTSSDCAARSSTPSSSRAGERRSPGSGFGSAGCTTSIPRRSTSRSPSRRRARSPRTPPPSWCCCRCGRAAAACGETWDGDEIPLACPRCGGVDVELIGGDELVLESIEYRA